MTIKPNGRQMMSKHTAEFLSKWNEHTDDQRFNYISNQYSLGKIWLSYVRKCKCKLDRTSADCRHIRRALKKLYGKSIREMFNETLKTRIETINEITGFKVPYSLQKELSA